MISLVESFLSIQGEGKHAGAPSLFLRFGGCNLSCKGFGVKTISALDGSTLIGCDSAFAANSPHFKHTWENCDAQNLFERVISMTKDLDYLPHIVITGGEPLIHHKERDFYFFIGMLQKKGFQIFFETNATIIIDFDAFPLYKHVGFAMSVKLSNSGEDFEKRVNQKAIKAICSYAKEAFFKFVVNKEMIENTTAKKEIDDITQGCENEIFCMPLGKNREELEKNSTSVGTFCIKNGYNYTDRIHIRLWDDKKGV